MLMKTQDLGYILQKMQSEKNVMHGFYISCDIVCETANSFPCIIVVVNIFLSGAEN